MAKLTNKQKAFVEIYLQTFNASKAARDTGTPLASSYQVGWRLLRNVEIQKAIAERLRRDAMATEEALARIAAQARGSLSPFMRVTDEGQIEWDFSDEEALANLHLLKKVHTKRKILLAGEGKNAIPWEHEWVEVELIDSQAALFKIGQHLKLFDQDQAPVLQLNILGLHEMLEKVYGNKSKR
jgi:hypothetical protein